MEMTEIFSNSLQLMEIITYFASATVVVGFAAAIYLMITEA